MPEGHTAHRLARDQQQLIERTLGASSPQGRFSAAAAELDGYTPTLIDAHGKHIHHQFENIDRSLRSEEDKGRHLHVHLGMQGKWFQLPSDRPPRPQVRLRLDAGDLAWDLIAPSTCEVLPTTAWRDIAASLGPDPLRDDADPNRAWSAIRRYPGTIGAALLDQSVIAGPGNVLRAECLFWTGVHPASPARSLGRDEFDRLWSTLVRLMAQAVDDGRIITAPLEPDQRANIAESDARMVYKQSVCRACGVPVETELIGGRLAYACPMHQPR